MGLIRNGIYGYRLLAPVGFLGSLPQKAKNFAQNALTWQTSMREYTSAPYGLYSSAFIMPIKYGAVACRMTGTAAMDSSISAVASISADVTGTASLAGSIAGGVNLSCNPQGSAQVVASASAKGWITCKIQIGANPTAFDVAQAVWGAVATMYNIPGTMGNKLNTASSGGVDTEALAEAVWSYER